VKRVLEKKEYIDDKLLKEDRAKPHWTNYLSDDKMEEAIREAERKLEQE